MAEIRPSMRLQCSGCAWAPAEDQTMGVVQEHFDAEHPDLDGVHLTLVAVCTCGRAMAFLRSIPVGNTMKDGQPIAQMEDRFICLGCQNTGNIRRDEPVDPLHVGRGGPHGG